MPGVTITKLELNFEPKVLELKLFWKKFLQFQDFLFCFELQFTKNTTVF